MLAVDPYEPRPYRVVARRRETRDTVTLHLQPIDGEGAYAYQPGQFNMLSAFGAGEVPISISGTLDGSDVLEHTIRAVGGATRRLVDLRPGNWVGLRGPFGIGWPLQAAQGGDVIVVAGGLGLAPLRPAIRHLLAHREDYRRVIVLYGARSPQDMLYPREIERWRSRFDAEVRVSVDRADASWRGNVGVAGTLFGEVEHLFQPAETTAMVCGPDVMMRFTIRDLQKRGLTDNRIYLSLERNMKCAIGLCGHCQYGPFFLCTDGPVFSRSQLAFLAEAREV